MSENAKKILLIICDGMSDRPVPSLGGKTPMQIAKMPNMDALAKNGICGIMDNIDKGVRPGSDTAHLAILGYDPYKIYTGRGPFEALGIGMELEMGDVAFRCNFATVDENMVITDRRAGRISEGTSDLAKSLNGLEIEGAKIIFKEAAEHRAVLVIRGKDLSGEVTDADPHSEGEKVAECMPTAEIRDGIKDKTRDKKLLDDADRTARIVNSFVRKSYEILKDHRINVSREKSGKPPANVVIPRGAGMAPDIEPFGKKYGISSSCIAGIPLVRGLCRYAGMDIAEVSGATGGTDTDIRGKLSRAVSELQVKDFVLVNVKGCDIYGHDGDALGKARFLEKIDAAMGEIVSCTADGVIVAITADHSTPVTVKDHSGDPVPILIAGESARPDKVTSFDEISCAHGGLGRIRGRDLVPILLDLANRSSKFGA